MISQSKTRLESFLEKQITNLDCNSLLRLEDQVHLSEIISNICNAIAALRFAKEGEEGERWKE